MRRDSSIASMRGSYPPGQCCTRGQLQSGPLTGSMTKIENDFDAYISLPGNMIASNGHGLLLLSDAMGLYQNTKLLADSFAHQGYICLAPDIFRGDPVPLNIPEIFDFQAWLSGGSTGDNGHTAEHIDPIILMACKALRDLGCNRIGAAGYCFGAKYVVRHCSTTIDCGFIAHPSFVEEEELNALSGPLSVAAAEVDDIFPVSMRNISEATLQGLQLPYQIVLYGGTSHGFATRADMDVQLERFGKEQAFKQAIAWFEEFL
ncbi:hypothetical protein LMH87_001037 [Akanthomyces muscarius]|uniref:Dienelactone hydrolase domain-containing protein n=1 Tax=Akanthomyces muscarius TaxID=2231603 RepID=A0A9W8ULN7_AKAMU|nr:hypothetical protein LMH87_001037 [Akanthomyces muscarius]KAJ4155808.1 hypothetical protein LMH87_001037 [Akanthomyces muscarius]